MWRAALILLTILAAGCRHAPLSYTIVASGPRTVVRPPVKPTPEILISNARKRAQAGCDIESEFAAIHWSKKAARIRLSSVEFFDDDPTPPPPGVVVGTDRMYTDSLKSVEDFRSTLFARAAAGCFTSEERINLLKAMTERFAFTPLIAYFLRFGTIGQAGFVELTADFRLKVVSPLGSGVQIAYYAISAAPKDDRVRLSLASLTATDPAKTASAPLPGLPAAFGYIRALFWTSLSSSNHYATLLAASDHAILENATRQFHAAPDGSCGIALPAGVACIPVPPNAAVNAEMRVSVNGEDAFIGIGGRLGEALPRTNRRPGTLPAGLRVQRLFRGRPVTVKFDPERPDILQLVLLPGDVIDTEAVTRQ